MYTCIAYRHYRLDGGAENLITTSLSCTVTSKGSRLDLDLLSTLNSSTTSNKNLLRPWVPSEVFTTTPSKVLIKPFNFLSTCLIGILNLVILGSSSSITDTSRIQYNNVWTKNCQMTSREGSDLPWTIWPCLSLPIAGLLSITTSRQTSFGWEVSTKHKQQ